MTIALASSKSHREHSSQSQEEFMTKVVTDIAMSLDGFIAGPEAVPGIYSTGPPGVTSPYLPS